MFAPRTTPKNELTFHKEVTTVLRHTIEGPINGAENRPWGRDLWLQEPPTKSGREDHSSLVIAQEGLCEPYSYGGSFCNPFSYWGPISQQQVLGRTTPR